MFVNLYAYPQRQVTRLARKNGAQLAKIDHNVKKMKAKCISIDSCCYNIHLLIIHRK